MRGLLSSLSAARMFTTPCRRPSAFRSDRLSRFAENFSPPLFECRDATLDGADAGAGDVAVVEHKGLLRVLAGMGEHRA